MFGKKNNTNYYYESFPKLCHFSVDCASEILSFMEHFDHSKLKDTKEAVHEIEHAADDHKHEVTEKLMTEFMTPIDREDIVALLRMIDDVTDAVEEISLKMYLYDYKELPPDTIPFMKLTLNCVKATEECLKHFPDFLDMKAIKPLILDVIHLEEASDTEYIDDLHALYSKETDWLRIHKGESMYTMLEECSDKCREVCKFVETIAYKNM